MSKLLVVGLIVPSIAFFGSWLSMLILDLGPRHPYIAIASGMMFISGFVSLMFVAVAISRLVSGAAVRSVGDVVITGVAIMPALIFVLFYFGVLFSDGA